MMSGNGAVKTIQHRSPPNGASCPFPQRACSDRRRRRKESTKEVRMIRGIAEGAQRSVWLSLVRRLVVGLCLISTRGLAEEVRYHGFQLTEQHHLLVEERAGGIVRVGLRGRTRPTGGLEADFVRIENKAETGRYQEVEYLVEVRSEVVKFSAPNYFQSRGSTYRLTVTGIDKGPTYLARRTVPASDARRVLADEFRKLWVQTEGIYQTALYWSVPIVLSVFKESGRMPAPVYATVAQSLSGATRTIDPSLTRRALPRGRTLGPAPGFRESPSLTGPARVRAEMAAPAPGEPSTRAGAASYQVPRIRAGGQGFQRPSPASASGYRSAPDDL